MLKNLHIQNYAIIEELSMNFGMNLNIITGETGAGKSILTGALGLIQGKRADSKVLYDTEKKCVVEAEFDNASSVVKSLFADNEMDFETPIFVRRIIAPNGKSRAFVNDEPVNLGFLKELSELLVDMHRQFDTLGINQEETQINMLDSLARNHKLLDNFKNSFSQYRKDKLQLEKLIAEEAKVKQELDFLEFQFSELDEAAFVENEQESLENEVNVLENADSIIQVMTRVNYQVEEIDNSILSQLAEMRIEMERMGDAGPQMESLLERIVAVEEELRDIAYQSSSVAENVEADPAKLEEKQERISLLYRLLQKHSKENLSELLEFQENLFEKVKTYRSYGKDRTSLENRVNSGEKILLDVGKEIHKTRKKSAPIFENKIKGLLAELGMEHAQFVIEINSTKNIRVSGTDEVQFLFSANPGRSPQALNEVASGGELSRLALSLKSIVAGNIELGTLIFDEIDTGISGDVSGKMGQILKKLATQHQLISITHSPQIASRADTHFFIYKLVENQRTYTKVKLLSHEERITEIATMLSGNPPSDGAKKNALELIESI